MGSGSHGAAGFASWLLDEKEREGGEDGTSVLPAVGGLAMLAGTITGDGVNFAAYAEIGGACIAYRWFEEEEEEV